MKKCGNCKFRSIDGYCQSPYLQEDFSCDGSDDNDKLIYSYTEGGSFWVGPNFGCVHHAISDDSSAPIVIPE